MRALKGEGLSIYQSINSIWEEAHFDFQLIKSFPHWEPQIFLEVHFESLASPVQRAVTLFAEIETAFENKLF